MPQSQNSSAPASSESAPQEPSDKAACKAALLDSIERLQLELEERKKGPRPLPSSVMRAYQALIDKHFAELTQL